MNLTEIKKMKRVLIYGFAREGKSTLRFLKKHAPRLRMDIFDAGIPAYAKEKPFNQYDAVVVSPGISRSKLRGVSKAKMTSNTELFFNSISESSRKKIIGITGTKGKSTTTKFMVELLNRADLAATAAGNFGTALLDVYDRLENKKLDYVVVELSSYQLENLRRSPGIAIFLNIFPDHLDRHGTMKKYTEAKQSIWRYQKTGDMLVIPSSSKKTVVARQAKSAVIYAPSLPKNYVSAKSVLRATHFLQDLGAVATVAKILRIPKEIVIKEARSFVGLPHRLELFARKRGIAFCDDAISVNPAASEASVRFFGKKLGSIILGGQDRGQAFDELVKTIRRTGASVLVLESETAPKIIAALKRQRYNHSYEVASLRDAVTAALLYTKKGGTCLLSPGAPSYDSFKNFEQKGDQFKKIVAAL